MMMGCLDFYMLPRNLLHLTPILAPISNVRVVPSRCAISYYMPSVQLFLQFPQTRCLNINKFLAGVQISQRI